MGDGHIFISYRRDDSAGYTRAIHAQLAQRFSADNIFMDVDSIEPGLPFDKVIGDAVGQCDVLLAMIGKRWLEPRDGAGPRMNDPRDFVRIEIAAALSRNIRVIPVLLDGATMPTEDVLPEPLRPLAWRNAIEVSNSRFSSDVERLAQAVDKAIEAAATPSVVGNVIGVFGRRRMRRSVLTTLLGGVAVAALLPAAYLLWPQPTPAPGPAPTPTPEPRPDTTFAGVPVQAGWRFCRKCHAMFFEGYSPRLGTCGAGGAHEAAGFNFTLAHDVPGPTQAQRDWRFCDRCFAMFYDGYPGKGVCPAGGTHNAQGYNFALPHDVAGPGQKDWRFCERCYAMFFNGFPAKGACPAPGGGGHVAEGFNFVLPHA